MEFQELLDLFSSKKPSAGKRTSNFWLSSSSQLSPGSLMRQNSTSSKMGPNPLVPACDGMVQSELGWPMHRKTRFSRPQHCVATSFTWFDSYGFLSAGSYQGQGLWKNYQSLADLKNSISTAFREDTTENVSASVRNLEKRLKIMIERGGAHASHRAINFYWKNNF